MKIILSLFFISILSLQVYCSDDTVSVTFKYNNPSAEKVSVAGSFNGWNPSGYEFIKKDTGWELNVKILPGYYYYKFVVDGNWIPDPLNPMKINDGGDSFNSILKAGKPPVPKRLSRNIPLPKEKLPEPVLKDSPEFVELYYAAWNIAWQKIMEGKKGSGLASSFMDEGFNEMIYQWDTCFMVLFAMYGLDVFPVMASIDNFYNLQRNDGYIQRVYHQETGKQANEPTADEQMVNPPLFAWVELRYYQITGDTSRIRKVLPHLISYYKWIDVNCRSANGSGLYYTTPLGSGMDNTPRFNMDKGGWIDFSSQQVLAAKCISELALVIKILNLSEEFESRYKKGADLINNLCWDNKSKFYFDVTASDTLCNTVHIGAYWTLLSDIAGIIKSSYMVDYLEDTLHFKRPHMVPTLSYSDKYFDPNGHYWRGSVWAPTNYMVIKGLEQKGYVHLANKIALNHVENIYQVFKNTNLLDLNKIAYEERYEDGYSTIWECYSSEYKIPATRWDNTFYSRQDFVGWSGLGPIALLIENIIGIKVNGAENKINWRILRADEHGIKNLSLKDQKVSLIYLPGDKAIKVSAEKEFLLRVLTTLKSYDFKVTQGDSILKIE